MTSAEATLSNYTVVRVIRGDLTTTECVAIVSSSGSDLSHAGGVSSVIANACGKGFRESGRDYVKQNGAIRVTEAYSQKAEGKPADHGVKYVIHAIAPNNCPEIKKLLKTTVLNALMEADSLNCETVALPAICSGIMGVPMDICAECYRSGLEVFAMEKAEPAIRRIDFVVDNEKAFTKIKAVLMEIPAPPPKPLLPAAVGNDAAVEAAIDIGRLNVSDLLESDQHSNICGICMDDLDNPETLSCSHTFCRECLAELTLSPCCPACGAPF